MPTNNFPAGWNQERVREILAHYDSQTPEEAIAEDEAACEAITQTVMGISVGLVSAERELIAGNEQG